MRQKEKNILGIDRGSKYIGLAYINKGASDMIMPIGYIANDGSAMFNIGDIIARYNIGKIVIWYPKDEDIQKKVDDFINQLQFIVWENIDILKANEEYSSVEAGAVTNNFKKNEAEDTLAAMKILENWIKNNW